MQYYDPGNPPKYIRISPFRFVQAYPHIYKTHAKQRWINKNILDAMENEFRAYTRDYYENAIKTLKLTINSKSIDSNYILKHGDLIEHTTLRYEPPVLDIPIQIVHDDDNYLVVSKPPSMIIHTGGGYHYNTLVGILYFEHNYHNIFVLHRLDRLTSGLLILSKNKETAQLFQKNNGENNIKKTYLARVHGNFPEEIKQSNKHIYCVSMKDAIYSTCCEEDAEKLNAKTALTYFEKIWYDDKSDTSLIECKLVTGRTHQIRVHLSGLKYPIVNDIGYGGKMIGNPILQEYFDKLEFKKQREKQDDDLEPKINKKIKLNDNEEQQIQHKEEKKEEKKEGEEVDVYNDCLYGYKEWDYENHPLEIFLHSWKYKLEDKEFESQKPYWYEKELKT